MKIGETICAIALAIIFVAIICCFVYAMSAPAGYTGRITIGN